MKTKLILAASAAAMLWMPTQAAAQETADAAKSGYESSGGALRPVGTTLKAASAKSIASRARGTSAATVFGGFELNQSAVVYILVRGNSMGTLGVTQDFLDAPRFRLYDALGRDLVFDNANRPGFNFCSTSNSDDLILINYYQNVRGAPVSSRDACLAANFSAGIYTFSVTPSSPANSGLTSSPGSGEILFEVTLGP